MIFKRVKDLSLQNQAKRETSSIIFKVIQINYQPVRKQNKSYIQNKFLMEIDILPIKHAITINYFEYELLEQH